MTKDDLIDIAKSLAADTREFVKIEVARVVLPLTEQLVRLEVQMEHLKSAPANSEMGGPVATVDRIPTARHDDLQRRLVVVRTRHISEARQRR